MLSRFRKFDPYRFVGPVNSASAPARTDRRTTRKRTVSDPACRMGGGVKPAFVCDRTDLLSGTNGCLRHYCSRRHDVAVWLCVSLRAPLCVCVRGNNCGPSVRPAGCCCRVLPLTIAHLLMATAAAAAILSTLHSPIHYDVTLQHPQHRSCPVCYSSQP